MTTKNAFLPIKHVNSMYTYSWISTIPRGSEQSEWASPWTERPSQASLAKRSKWAMRANERSERPSGPFKTRLSVTRNAPQAPMTLWPLFQESRHQKRGWILLIHLMDSIPRQRISLRWHHLERQVDSVGVDCQSYNLIGIEILAHFGNWICFQGSRCQYCRTCHTCHLHDV